MIVPTIQKRIGSLDLLRGIAILGILLANIPVFAYTYAEALASVDRSSADGPVRMITLILVNGKFRSMLAVLFGVGLWLQFTKRTPIPGAWPQGYLKRSAILALIGLAHGILLWYGDILFMYALTATVAAFTVRFSDHTLWLLTAILGFLAFGLFVLCLMGALMLSPDRIQELMGEEGSGAVDLLIYGSGSYGEQVMDRLVFFSLQAVGAVFYVPFLLPLFWLGIIWSRSGVLARPSMYPKMRNMALIVGFGIGLPVNLLALLLQGDSNVFVQLGWELLPGPLLGLGYLMLGAMWVESGRSVAVQTVLQSVGRVALSVYLMQSLLCTFVFYSWGLGLFGKLDRLELLGVVAVVWLLNIAFAMLWLRKFVMGPVEWAWRSLTEGKRAPLRPGDVPASPPPIAAPPPVITG